MALKTFKILCEVERADLLSAMDLSRQLVEHGYVDAARVTQWDSRNLVNELTAEANREVYGGLTFNAFPPEDYSGIIFVYAAIRLGDHAHVEIQSGRWLAGTLANGTPNVGLAGRIVLRWHEWLHMRDELDRLTPHRIAEVEKPTQEQMDRYVTHAPADEGKQIFD